MAKTIGIMQPYFLPYMGYWQLINAVDEFILYDNIEYTKKGWITRNRFLLNGKDEMFSLSLKADSDYLSVAERELSSSFERDKLIRQLQGAYQKAPHYADNFPVIENIIRCQEINLSRYIENSVRTICEFLDIRTPIVMSSTVPIDHKALKAEDKVVAICHARLATHYLNPSGGISLYDKDSFRREGITLSFLRSQILDYQQFGHPAIPHLSILDVLMFNSRDRVQNYLKNFEVE